MIEPQVHKTGWVVKTFFFIAMTGTFIGVIVGGGVYWHFSRDLPKIVTPADYRPLSVTRIIGQPGGQPGIQPSPQPSGQPSSTGAESVLAEDAVLGEFYKERRYVIPYDKIPEVVVRAFISAEDDKFFEHPGINFTSMIRAGIANFRAGHVVQGGSTITQQVAKSLVLTSERSFVRKIKEVIVASSMERNLTKQQILYLYLNQIYLGHGAYGVQAACKTYFRKDISQISVAEAALLAGLPQAPGKYSPVLNPKKAKERQLYVLRRMYENKFITQTEMSDAAAQSLKIYHDEDINKKYAPYLVEHIRRYLVEKYGDKAVYEHGLTVTVPATRELSVSAAKSLRSGLEAVDKRMGYRGPIKHLKKNDEIEAFLKEMRLELIERKVHYQLLLPDGRMGAIEAMQAAGIRSDVLLLDRGETYKAIVTSVNDKKKTATVMIGAVAAELPMDQMKWAKPPKDEKNPNVRMPEPTLPSKVLAKGDVILVKILSLPGIGPSMGPMAAPTNTSGVIVGLEQEPQVQGAVFSVEVQTGNVLAMVGGYDFEKSEFNRAIQALRQPGSAFKPIIYSAALERGYNPATIIMDSPIIYEDAESGKWKPSNFEEKFYGDTTFRQALIKSRNVPTIKIVQSLQVARVIDYARRLGMSGQFPADLSISLGSASVSLLDLTKAYALFPRLGRKVTPVFISRVTDRDGRDIEELKPQLLSSSVSSGASPSPIALVSPEPAPLVSPQVLASPTAVPGVAVTIPGIDAFPLPNDPDQVLDPRIASVMTHLMKEVVNYGTGHEAKNLGRPAAGKTGTTNEYIDAWFMGFTPNVVTGVWVGFDSQKSIGHSETGARAALPIWVNYMREAVKNYSEADFTVPPGVVFASINPMTGKLASPNSSMAIKEAFIEGTEPKQTSEGLDEKSDTSGDFFKEDVE